MDKKITRVFVDITFDDGSSTFQHFTSPEGAQGWLDDWLGQAEDEEENGDSEKQNELEAEGVKIED